MIVYCITNKINGKTYVGKTSKTLKKRWAAHCADARAGSQLPIHSAITKYDENSFSVVVLSFHNSDLEMSEAEKKAILEIGSHVSTGMGYNVTWGGDGLGSGEKHPWFGHHHTEEFKKRLSDAQLGDKNVSHKNAGENHWNRGLIRSEETKIKIREKRASQDMSYLMKAQCKRGHIRTPDNLTMNGTCKQCKKLLRREKP